MPMLELLRDRMPPLEDLIVGGQPAPVGLGSGVAVIIGGLFLLYRGLIDFRIPLLAPVRVRRPGRPAGPDRRPRRRPALAVARPARDPGRGVGRGGDVRRNYELMAGPLLFVASSWRPAPPSAPEPPVPGDLRGRSGRPVRGRPVIRVGVPRAVPGPAGRRRPGRRLRPVVPAPAAGVSPGPSHHVGRRLAGRSRQRMHRKSSSSNRHFGSG